MTQFEEAQKSFEDIAACYALIGSDYLAAKQERDALCPHTVTTKEESFSSAGYDYVSKSVYWDKCSCCGKKLNERIEYGNSFG